MFTSLMMATNKISELIYNWIWVLVNYSATANTFSWDDYWFHLSKDWLHLYKSVRWTCYQYELTTAFDLNSVVWTWSQDTRWSWWVWIMNINWISISDDWTKMIQLLSYLTANFEWYRSYTLTTPWDITTAVQTWEKNMWEWSSTWVRWLSITRDWLHAYSSRLWWAIVYYTALSTAWVVWDAYTKTTISTTSWSSWTLSFWIFVNEWWDKMFVGWFSTLDEYTLSTNYIPENTKTSTRAVSWTIAWIDFSYNWDYLFYCNWTITKYM